MSEKNKDPNNWQPVYKDLESIIGKENTLKLYNEFRGLYINFPMKLYSKDGLKAIVKDEYNGSNSRIIARKYGYSVRHINRIIRQLND